MPGYRDFFGGTGGGLGTSDSRPRVFAGSRVSGGTPYLTISLAPGFTLSDFIDGLLEPAQQRLVPAIDVSELGTDIDNRTQGLTIDTVRARGNDL